MRPILGIDNAQLYEQVNAQRSRIKSYIGTATPELADRLGRAATAYNWVDPGIIAAMVLSGNDSALEQVSKQVGQKAWKYGVSPVDRQPDRITPQEQAVILERLRNNYRPVKANKRYTPPKQQPEQPEEDGGFWNTVMDVIGGVKDFAYGTAKAGVVGLTSGLSAPLQFTQASVYNLANYLPSGHSFRTQRNKNLFEQFVVGPIKQTDVAQIAIQSAKGLTSKDKVTWEDIAGSGFFAGGNVRKAQAQAAREYRPLIGTGEDVSAFTFGRAGGQALADIGIVEEGSLAYNIVSGLIDFGTTIKMDPTIGRAKGRAIKPVFGAESKAASAVSDSEAIKATAGIVAGSRPTVVPNLWDGWKNTPEATKILEPIVTEKSPAQVWRAMRRQGILTADELAQAGDHNSVVTAIDKAVNNLDPAYNVRNLPAGNFESLSDAGYKIKQSAQRYTRMFEVFPESTFIPRNDVNLAATRLDDLMGYLGFKIETRDEWINRLIEVHKSGTSDEFFNFLNDWETKVLQDALEKNGVPKSEAKRLSRWRQETIDQSARLTLQDLGNGVPAAWMEAGNYGPVRTTQLFQDGAHIIDPSQIDEVVQKLGKLYRFEQEAKKLGVVGYPARAGLKTVDVMGDIYGFYQTYLWKPITVAAGRYLTRVLPDEVGRSYLNGTFDHPLDYVLAMFDGRLSAKVGIDGKFVADVFGENMNKVVSLRETETRISYIYEIQKQIKQLKAQGRIQEANDLYNLNKADIDGLGDLLVAKERAERALEDGMPSLNEALIGNVPRRASRRILGDYKNGSFIKSKAVDIVSKNVAREAKLWVKGVVQEVADLHNNQHIRRIANGGLFDADELRINGVMATWKEHLAAGRSLPAEEAIAQWLFSGSGRGFFQKYFTNYANIKPGYNWDTIENAREFVRVLNNEVSSIAGTNKEILDTIVTGMHNGKKAFSKTPTNIVVGEDGFNAFVANVFSNDSSAPTHIRYRPERGVPAAGLGSKAVAAYDWIFDSFFKTLYGKSSDFLSRSPDFRAAYWGRIEEVAPILNRKAADELLSKLPTANLPKAQEVRIQRLLQISNGANDLETADFAARSFALRYVRDLLFDQSKRSWAGDHYKYTFPFFEAYREQGSTWAKIFTQNPSALHKIDLALRALRDTEGVSPYDSNQDGKKDGFLFRDPQSGEEMFGVPGSGLIGRWFSNVPFGGFSLPSGSLTLVSNILPGFGPAVQYPLQYFVPTTKKWSWLNDIFFPYGRPEETGQQPLGGLADLTVPRPTWLRRMTPYLSDLARDMPGIDVPVVGKGFGRLMGDFIKRLGSNEEETQIYKAYYANVFKSVSSTTDIPNTQKEMESLLSEVEERTNKLYFLRGLANFTLPGTPVSKFFAETKVGPVELGVLADSLREFEKEAKDAGLDSSTGSQKFLDTYGESVWAIFANVRRSDKYQGLVMSKEFEDWFESNKKLVETYPAVAGYFGPQTEPTTFGPIEQRVYNRFIQKGIIKVQQPEDFLAEAQNNVAFTIYENFRNQMPLATQRTVKGKEALRNLKEGLKEKFPKWDISMAGQMSASKREDQIRQLREIVTEPQLKNNRIAEAVKGYLDARDKGIEDLFSRQGIRGWQKGQRSLALRSDLEAVGTALAVGIPGFKHVWDKVLSREFELPSMEE